MRSNPFRILLVAVVVMAAGCASGPTVGKAPSVPAEQMLAEGIRSYEEGEYGNAGKRLQEALNAGLSRKDDRVKARKYLAFIDCVSEKTQQCSDEFRKAFNEDPNFTLEPAEAGHPIWGPVYRGVRDQMKPER